MDEKKQVNESDVKSGDSNEIQGIIRDSFGPIIQVLDELKREKPSDSYEAQAPQLPTEEEIKKIGSQFIQAIDIFLRFNASNSNNINFLVKYLNEHRASFTTIQQVFNDKYRDLIALSDNFTRIEGFLNEIKPRDDNFSNKIQEAIKANNQNLDYLNALKIYLDHAVPKTLSPTNLNLRKKTIEPLLKSVADAFDAENIRRQLEVKQLPQTPTTNADSKIVVNPSSTPQLLNQPSTAPQPIPTEDKSWWEKLSTPAKLLFGLGILAMVVGIVMMMTGMPLGESAFAFGLSIAKGLAIAGVGAAVVAVGGDKAYKKCCAPTPVVPAETLKPEQSQQAFTQNVTAMFRKIASQRPGTSLHGQPHSPVPTTTNNRYKRPRPRPS